MTLTILILMTDNFVVFYVLAGYEALTLTNFVKHFSSLFSVKLAQIWSKSSFGAKSFAEPAAGIFEALSSAISRDFFLGFAFFLEQ